MLHGYKLDTIFNCKLLLDFFWPTLMVSHHHFFVKCIFYFKIPTVQNWNSNMHTLRWTSKTFQSELIHSTLVLLPKLNKNIWKYYCFIVTSSTFPNKYRTLFILIFFVNNKLGFCKITVGLSDEGLMEPVRIKLQLAWVLFKSQHFH